MHRSENNCPFCNPTINTIAFAESLNFLAVYNIASAFPGHSLVIPKMHLTSFTDLSDELLLEMLRLSKKVVRIIQVAFNTDAFNWTIQEKEEAGQSVMHLHLYIIPRYKGDLPDPGDWYPKLRAYYDAAIDSS